MTLSRRVGRIVIVAPGVGGARPGKVLVARGRGPGLGGVVRQVSPGPWARPLIGRGAGAGAVGLGHGLRGLGVVAGVHGTVV